MSLDRKFLEAQMFYENKISDLEAKLAESERKLNIYPYKNEVIEEQYEELKNGIKFRFENNITNDWEQLYHCIDVLCEKHKARIRDIEDGICKIEQLELLLKAKEKMKTQSLKGFEKLKQQLAQKDKQLEKLKSENHALVSDNAYQEADMFELNSHIEQLQKQLADTETQNKRVLEKLELIVSANQELEQKLAEKEEQVLKSQEMYFETLKEYDELEDNFNNISLELWAEKLITQEKISFAVEQLEQLKIRIKKRQEYWNTGVDYEFTDLLPDYDIYEEIDNQIKQLKEIK